MSKKFKSLLFFSLFILLCIVYISTDEDNNKKKEYSLMKTSTMELTTIAN